MQFVYFLRWIFDFSSVSVSLSFFIVLCFWWCCCRYFWSSFFLCVPRCGSFFHTFRGQRQIFFDNDSYLFGVQINETWWALFGWPVYGAFDYRSGIDVPMHSFIAALPTLIHIHSFCMFAAFVSHSRSLYVSLSLQVTQASCWVFICRASSTSPCSKANTHIPFFFKKKKSLHFVSCMLCIFLLLLYFVLYLRARERVHHPSYHCRAFALDVRIVHCFVSILSMLWSAFSIDFWFIFF